MPPRKIEIPEELMAEGRRLYEKTATPLPEIAAMMGIARETLRSRVREWCWVRRRRPNGAIDLVKAVRGATVAALTAPAAPQPAIEPAPPLTPERRAALAARIVAIVEEQMEAVKRVLVTIDPKDQAEGERSTRMLASLAVTLRESATILQIEQATAPHAAEDDDPVPRDIDEYRIELARRIRNFIEARQAGVGGVPAQPERSLE